MLAHIYFLSCIVVPTYKNEKTYCGWDSIGKDRGWSGWVTEKVQKPAANPLLVDYLFCCRSLTCMSVDAQAFKPSHTCDLLLLILYHTWYTSFLTTIVFSILWLVNHVLCSSYGFFSWMYLISSSSQPELNITLLIWILCRTWKYWGRDAFRSEFADRQ